ncbi:MAG: S24/S26 family peptidase [Pseudomonadota bacterium]
MLGLSFIRTRDRSMEPSLPLGAGAFFRRVERVKRGDMVLVDTADHGRMVRKVRAVSVSGRVALQRINRSDEGSVRVDHVEPQAVLGRLFVRLRWLGRLPVAGTTPTDERVDEPVLISPSETSLERERV